jgi:hypothetical protein
VKYCSKISKPAFMTMIPMREANAFRDLITKNHLYGTSLSPALADSTASSTKSNLPEWKSHQKFLDFMPSPQLL